jgi:CHASE2 domain-containing sensor protein
MGHLLELPQSSHPFYSYMSGSIIALFGLVYVWLALQPIIVRSVLLIGTSGKLIAVLISFGLTISGDLSPIVATAIAGDLLFVGLWIYYLMQTQKPEGLVAE